MCHFLEPFCSIFLSWGKCLAWYLVQGCSPEFVELLKNQRRDDWHSKTPKQLAKHIKVLWMLSTHGVHGAWGVGSYYAVLQSFCCFESGTLTTIWNSCSEVILWGHRNSAAVWNCARQKVSWLNDLERNNLNVPRCPNSLEGVERFSEKREGLGTGIALSALTELLETGRCCKGLVLEALCKQCKQTAKLYIWLEKVGTLLHPFFILFKSSRSPSKLYKNIENIEACAKLLCFASPWAFQAPFLSLPMAASALVTPAAWPDFREGGRHALVSCNISTQSTQSIAA